MEDQLLELWNEAGNEAGRQGMMLMGYGEDDAGTSEAVIESGDGGRAGSGARRAAAEEVALGAMLQKRWRSARCCRRSGARRAAEEEEELEALLRQGRAADAGGTSGCARDERAQRLIGWAETPKTA